MTGIEQFVQSRSSIQTGKGPPVEPLPFSNDEYESRLDRVRARMRASGMNVVVAFSPENINHMTGHDTPAYQYLQACIIPSSGMPVNLLRSTDASNTLYRSWNRSAVVYADNDDPVSLLSGLILDLPGAAKCIGFERDPFFIGASRYNRLMGMLAAAGKTIVEQSFVEDLRLKKSPAEIVRIRQAAKATEAAMKAAVEMAAEGVNENEIAACVWATLVRKGGEFPGLPPFIVSGPRTSLGHALWSSRRTVLRSAPPRNCDRRFVGNVVG